MLSSCSAIDESYRLEGAGLEVMHPSTPASTDAIESYFGELCVQADLIPASTPRPRGCTTSGLGTDGWQRIVSAGFNDIDLRCDRYLGWLDEKRNEQMFVQAGLTQVGSLAAGVLGLAAPASKALNYVGVALGFVSNTYDAYNNLLLLGIESSTVKTIVTGRRLKFRETFRTATYSNKSDVVYTLRSYLRICTPQTITMDINTYSRAAITGETPPQDANLKIERDVLGPRKVTDPGRVPIGKINTTSDVAEVFVGTGFTRQQLRALQRKLCVADPENTPEKARPETLAAVATWEELQYAAGATPEKDERISNVEWDGDKTHKGLKNASDCSKSWTGYYYEFATFGLSPRMEGTFIGLLKSLYSSTADIDSINSPAARELIATARRDCKAPLPASGKNDGLTKGLYDKILKWATATPKGNSCDQI